MGAPSPRLVFDVAGLHCGGCVTTLERVLLEVDGVQSATVQLEEQQAIIVGLASAPLLQAAATTIGKSLCVRDERAGRTTVLNVDGMSCSHCTGQVQAALEAVEGVESAEVDLKSGDATVMGTASAEALVSAVKATGKGVTVTTSSAPAPTAPASAPRVAPTGDSIVLTVDGMSCGHCSARVHEALVAVPGVESADVDLEAGRATVTGTAHTDALVAAVESSGHGANLEPRQASYVIAGLSCQGCIATVKRALLDVEGVSYAALYLTSGRALVSGTATFDELADAIRSVSSVAL